MTRESPHTFAQLLVASFRDKGEKRPIYYDETTFKLVLDGEDQGFWIGNLRKDYLRSSTQSRESFFANAWKIWCLVQNELPAPPPWVPEILRPFRDETHPLSYRVEEAPNTALWTVAPPFDEPPEIECFTLVDAYHVWWGSQFQRACKKHLYNIYGWLTSGQVDEAALQVLSDLRRIWRQGRLLAMSADARLAQELALLGGGTTVPPVLRQLLDGLQRDLHSFDVAARALRHLRIHGP